MSTLQITNGRVIDIETGNITKKTLYIKDGKFAQGKVGPADETLDVADAFLAPGFIDLHTHSPTPLGQHYQPTGHLASGQPEGLPAGH